MVNIHELDPKYPRHVADLNNGIYELDTLRDQLRQKIMLRNSTTAARVRDILQKSGVEAKVEDLEVAEKIIAPGVKIVTSEFSITYQGKTKRDIAVARGLVEEFEDSEKAKEIEESRQRRNLDRQWEEYADAALKLTQVTPLVTVDNTRPTAHFFIVRPEGVYEARVNVDKEELSCSYKPIPNVSPEKFQQVASKSPNDFFRYGVGDVNPFMVTNPVNVLPLRQVIEYATQQTFDTLKEARVAFLKDKEARKSLGEKLVERVRSHFGEE